MLTFTLMDFLPVLISFGFKLITAIVGIISLWLTLKFFDRISGGYFAFWIDQATPHELANYYAVRFLGACIYFGLVLS